MKKEDLFGYIFVLFLSIAMAMGSLAQATGHDGLWTPVILWVNTILWVAMCVLAFNMLYRFIRQTTNR